MKASIANVHLVECLRCKHFKLVMYIKTVHLIVEMFANHGIMALYK